MDEADLTAVLREHATRHSVPGASIGVLRDGVVTTASYGIEDVRTGEPVTPATRFSVGSLTKSMVATVIARLAEAGRLSLDDPVVEHVQELRGSIWVEGVTVRDLLANRSGLPLRADLEFAFDRRPGADDGALARLVAEIPRDEVRSSVWSYSNVGWCVLGRMIETVTGATWEDGMRELLELRDTSFGADPAVERRVSGHAITPEGPRPVEPLAARAYGPAGTTGVTTVDDLLRFAGMQLDDPALAALRVVHADVSIHGWLDAWCLGLARFDWAGGPVWGWDSVVNGERAVLRLLPEHRAAVALMTNADTGRAVYRSLLVELMPSLFGIEGPRLPIEPSRRHADDLARFAGLYAWPDSRVEVSPSAGGLLLADEDGESEALPLDGRAFVVDRDDADTPTVTFGAFDADGRPGVLYRMLWGLPRRDRG